jgi:hypothetical protein
MRVTVNEPFLRRRANIARWTTLIGLGILFVGLLVSFNKQYYYLSLPALIVGFILANISGFNSNRYVKEPRPDQSLAKSLKAVDTFPGVCLAGETSRRCDPPTGESLAA